MFSQIIHQENMAQREEKISVVTEVGSINRSEGAPITWCRMPCLLSSSCKAMKGILSSQTDTTYGSSGIRYGEVIEDRGILLSFVPIPYSAELRAFSTEASAFRFRFFESKRRTESMFTGIKSSSVSSENEKEYEEKDKEYINAFYKVKLIQPITHHHSKHSDVAGP